MTKVETGRGIIYFYISNQRATLDLCERLCSSFELLDRLIVALLGVVVNSQFCLMVSCQWESGWFSRQMWEQPGLTVSLGFFLVGCALYYIFPQDLSHSLGMFNSLLCFDAASLDAAVLVERVSCESTGVV